MFLSQKLIISPNLHQTLRCDSLHLSIVRKSFPDYLAAALCVCFNPSKCSRIAYLVEFLQNLEQAVAKKQSRQDRNMKVFFCCRYRPVVQAYSSNPRTMSFDTLNRKASRLAQFFLPAQPASLGPTVDALIVLGGNDASWSNCHSETPCPLLHLVTPPRWRGTVTCGGKPWVLKDSIPNGTRGGDGHLAAGTGNLRSKALESLVPNLTLRNFLRHFWQ